ncbi:MAG: hypothetical protein ACRDR6_18615 [Pseudonocardiaceae bacterium]
MEYTTTMSPSRTKLSIGGKLGAVDVFARRELGERAVDGNTLEFPVSVLVRPLTRV